nr:hypothetical protein [Deinococcus wulumuqiensis]
MPPGTPARDPVAGCRLSGGGRHQHGDGLPTGGGAHGGIFVLAIPGAVTNLPMYVVAIVAGTVVSTVLLGLLKRPLTGTAGGEQLP